MVQYYLWLETQYMNTHEKWFHGEGETAAELSENFLRQLPPEQ